MEKKIRIAEERIEQAKERRAYFITEYQKTGEALYKELAENETESIDKIQNAIIEALLQKK